MRNIQYQKLYIFLTMFLLIGISVTTAINGATNDEFQLESNKNAVFGFTEPSVEWNESFGGLGDQDGYSVCQTSDGGYVVCGYSSVDLKRNVLLIKISEDGMLEWTKLFDSDYVPGATSIIETQDGGFVLTGVSVENKDNTNILLLKTDNYGSLLWKKSFDHNDVDAGMEIKETGNGNLIIVGYSGKVFADLSEICDIWVINTDAEGNMVWDYIYENTTFCMGFSVCETSDNGFVVVGEESFQPGDSRIIVLKLDEIGKLSWKKSYNPGPSHDGAYSVIESSDQHIIIAGYAHLQGSDGILYKLDSWGEVVWSHIFEGIDYEDFQSVKETIDGGFIIAGSTSHYEDFWIVRTDKQGLLLWEKILGGSNRDRSHDIQQTTDCGYVVVGCTRSFAEDGDDVWVIKLDSDDKTQPNLDLFSPKNALYLNNKMLFSFPIPVIIGSISVEVNVYDEETGISEVEWYIDNEMVCSKTSEPFLWMWNEKQIGKSQLTIKAFDKAGNEQILSKTVWKYF
jgi:hypothetical protein